MTGDPLIATDRHVAEWFRTHTTPGLTVAIRVISFFASPFWVTCIAVLTGVVLWWKRCWYRLLALALVIAGGMVQLPLLKMVFHRQRPNHEGAFLFFQGYSFPSGHTLAATLLYGLLAVFAVLSFDSWCRRAQAIFGAFAMILLVGVSRTYLGAHYLSDVLSRHFSTVRTKFEIYETRKGDLLAEIVRGRLREGFDLVVAAGGDGTVSAVSDGPVGSLIPLGIIPLGTGNLIARELGIPDDIEAAVALFSDAPVTRKIDAMRMASGYTFSTRATAKLTPIARSRSRS